ncbi:hypothetical protein LTR53_015850, partial [Teratosphaeriaceae sp. CCFEE 6253]
EGALGLAIEVLIYTTKQLTTLFVSKADTTGYIPNHRPSRIQALCTTFVQWLVEQQRHRHPRRKVVVSLFARAQSQYLFPGSAEHSNKHVLDDRQLIKWWALVLDPLLDTAGEAEPGPDINGYITIPGYDSQELRAYLPRTSHSHGRFWKPGYPLAELAETRGVPPTAPPRSLLPRFPDDPKARFMSDLDDEVGLAESAPVTVSPSKRKSGRWNHVRDLPRFWEAMEFRQECSSGRVVGFLWVVVAPVATVTEGNDVDVDAGCSLESIPGVPRVTQRETTPTPASYGEPKKRKRRPLTGPIIPRQPRLKGGSSSLTASSADLNGMLDSTRGDGLLVSQEGYDRAMHTLLHLDFANLDVAARSTTKWVAEVASIAGLAGDWAVEVAGTASVVGESRPMGDSGNVGKTGEVNDLGSMVRRKRKAGEEALPPQDHSVKIELPAVNVLGAGAVRKKPKPGPGP